MIPLSFSHGGPRVLESSPGTLIRQNPRRAAGCTLIRLQTEVKEIAMINSRPKVWFVAEMKDSDMETNVP